MSKNMNKRATENSILKFLTDSSVSSDIIVKGIIDDIINTAVKTAEVDKQKTNIYNILLINMTQSCQIKQRYTFHLHPSFIE
jgi:adenine deaminase